MSVMIVGASVAGLRTAQALRLRGYQDPITLIGAEDSTPYDKPPLSKDMLLPDGAPEPVALLSDAELAALDLDLQLGQPAVALDPVQRTVSTAVREQTFDRLVIATGSIPRTLPTARGLDGVHTLRTVEDAVALRRDLTTARRAVVVGAGFIGAEVASAARAHGIEVTIVEVMDVPLAHLLGREAAVTLARIHELNGVRVLSSSGVAGFTGNGHVTGVVLTDGTELPADVVVVGIGARPATDWLADSGLPLSDGIECDTDLNVLGATGIYAVGDVARFQHPMYPDPIRVEHWTNANEHAGIVAAAILGVPTQAHQVPYVWSDQYGHRIQIVGRPFLGRAAHLAGSLAEGSLVAVYGDDNGLVVGGLVVDDPHMLMKCRRAIAKRQTVDSLGLVGA